jgi:polar amino acid transport system permease protein
VPNFVDSFLDINSALTTAPLLWSGLLVTLQLVVMIIPSAIVLGLLIGALRDLKVPVVSQLLRVYVDLMRSFPPLVLLIFLYSGLPFLGIHLSEYATVVLGLTANGAAFFGEIFRAGFASIGKGQREAGLSTGLSRLVTEIVIVMPQGIRKVIPPVASNIIELVKATALGSVLALPELLRTARMAQGMVYDATPLIIAAAVYLLLLWPFVRLLSHLEMRMTLVASK